MKYIFPLLLMSLAFASCAKKKADKQAKEDEAIIQDFIAEFNLSAVPTGSGLYYVMETEGTGAQPTSTSTVKVVYTGYFTNGQVFDASDNQGIEISLQNVIEGWKEGVPYFKEGGTGKLLIPSALGYGPTGTATIPPNSVIIFDIELVEVL
jgi:FKBP-type peptidyl-prolyl cis-trans isomerase FkpA